MASYLPALHLPNPIQKSFSFTADPSKLPFSYSHPLPNPPKLHTRISVPKVLPIVRAEDMATPVHLQYNSPMSLYSKESAEEQYSQQMAGVGGAGGIALPNQEKHFDATKSKVLQEIQRGDQDHFGESFAEQIARAETPKMFNQQEPSWANTARTKSERARSRTPGARDSYTPSDPYQQGAVGYPYQQKLGGAADEAREYAAKSRTFVHANHGDGYGPAYYQVQQHSPRPRSRSESARGYELGGTDYSCKAGHHYYGNPEERMYVDLTRKQRETSQPPVAGSDFGSGAIGYGTYHGHGPDPPRLRPKYTADPREPVNLFVAPNVDAVDGNLLVGDTLSNQKVSPRPAHPDTSFGTSFAPPQGHRPDHRTYRAAPKPDEPVTFCVSAPKSMMHQQQQSYGYSSAPSHQQDVYRERQAQNDKEVSVHTLLTDEALRPRRREHTPEWVGASLSKQHQWKHRSDPRLDKSLEVYYTEPNWKRNVDQRKNAWERKAFETEQSLHRPKAPASGAPYWANRAEQTHNTWARAADDVGARGGQQHYGGQNGGGYQTQQHDYSNGGHHQQSSQNYSSSSHNNFNNQSSAFPSQQHHAAPAHFSQPLSVGFGGQNNALQMHSPGGYSVHNISQSGDKNSGNYASSEHFEKERNEGNRFEKSSYTHSESKSTTVNGQPANGTVVHSPAPASTFQYANGGNQFNNNSSSQFSQQHNFQQQPVQQQQQPYHNSSSSFNKSSSTRNETTKTTTSALSPRLVLDKSPLQHHHLANGVETDILNTGFNENQKRYFDERHAAPTPHHHHSPLPQRTNTSSSVALPGGGHKYTNFSSETSGAPGGPAYSTSEKYTAETNAPNGGRSFESSAFSRSEQKTSSVNGVPQTWTPSENRNSSSYNQNYHHESNRRNETTTSTTSPLTGNTSYSYAQQPIASQMSPGQTRYEHYSMKRHEEKKEETRPVIALPAPAPVQQESRYERYSSNRHEETKTESRPVSQLSNYTESRQHDYKKSSNEKTTTTTSSAAPHVTTSSTLSQDAFDRKAEMAEQLPRGTISNTHNNTQGGYRDHSGHDVSYKRELATSSDPGRDVSLLKEEEKRIIEKPLEPGVISRHVTTKYYKKKTTTDTTTTTTPEN